MFNDRPEEVKKILDAAAAQMETLPPLARLSPEDQAKVRKGLADYFSFRERTLKDGLKLLSDTSKPAKELTGLWSKHFQQKGSEAIKMIADANKEIKLAKIFEDFDETFAFSDAVSNIAYEESVFFRQLSSLPLPDAMHGKLNEYRKEFEKEKKNLLDKWTDLLGKDKNIDGKMDEVTKKLFQVFQEGLKKVNVDHTKTRERIMALVKAAHVVDDATSPGTPSYLEPVSHLLDHISMLTTSSKELSRRFEELYKSEETVVVILFGKTRQSVKEFLENTNLDKAIQAYEAAEKKNEEIARKMPTKGQQEDALDFVDECAKITENHLEAFEKAYNEFVNAFRGIFIGPVGDRTVEDLIEKERWNWAKNEWQRMDIQTELKKMYDDAREWWAIDMDDVHPNHREKIEELLEKERKRLEPALKAAADRNTWDSIEFLVVLQKEFIVDKIRKLVGWTE